MERYLAGKNPQAIDLFRRFQRLVEACGPSQVSVAKTVVYFKRERVFAGAFLNGRRLEVVIDLLRRADHPRLIGVFASTKKVWSHRLRLDDPRQLDESIAALLAEAHEQVGPGTR